MAVHSARSAQASSGLWHHATLLWREVAAAAALGGEAERGAGLRVWAELGFWFVSAHGAGPRSLSRARSVSNTPSEDWSSSAQEARLDSDGSCSVCDPTEEI